MFVDKPICLLFCLIEKIKQMPDDYIDTDPKQFYEDLEWSDSQHRIKGI